MRSLINNVTNDSQYNDNVVNFDGVTKPHNTILAVQWPLSQGDYSTINRQTQSLGGII